MNKPAILLITILAVALFSIGCNMHEQAEETTSVMDSIAKFIPEGYVLLDTASGDLNKDGVTDMVLITRLPDEEETSDGIANPTLRPLLLLNGKPDRSFELAARNDSIILCVDCNDRVEGEHVSKIDPYGNIRIKDSLLDIGHNGPYFKMESHIYFIYDPAKKKLMNRNLSFEETNSYK